jgi:hypothetical protein
MPASFCDRVSRTSGSKHSIMMTNVPGFIKPVYYGGQKAKRFFYMGAGTGNLCTGVVIVSIDKRCCVTVSSDDTQIKDTKAFAELFNV